MHTYIQSQLGFLSALVDCVVVKCAASCLHHNHAAQISLWQSFANLFELLPFKRIHFVVRFIHPLHARQTIVRITNSTAKLLLKNAKRKCCHFSLDVSTLNNKNVSKA